MAAEQAIKDLIQEVLKDFFGEQEQTKLQNAEMAKKLEELSGKIVERELEADKVRERLDSFQKDMEDRNGKSQAQLDEDVKTIKDRLDLFEDDANGRGGLVQVHAKCTELDRILNEMLPKMEDSMRLVKENTSRTEGFDRQLRDVCRQCEEIAETMKASEERLAKIEGITSTVSTAMQAVEDSVARKYEKLWEDVLHHISEMNGSCMDAVKRDLEEQMEANKTKTMSLVNFAQNFMASALGERRQMAKNRTLVLAWKEQTWIAARRKLGLRCLEKIVRRRENFATPFYRWHRGHLMSSLCDRLHGQYTSQLEGVYKDMKAGDDKLSHRCDKLDDEAHKAATKKSLQETVQQLHQSIKDEMKALNPIRHTLEGHTSLLHEHSDLHRTHTDAEAITSKSMSRIGSDLAWVIQDCKEYAKNEEVKGMIRDILLIWNSIKQLDTAKADKKDVDTFALETGNRDKLSARRLEDLEADFLSKSRQETIRVQEKWSEMEGRLDESGRQFQHWEQMWEKLSGFVEDLVAKVGDLQGATTMKSARAGSRSDITRSRPDARTVPTNFGPGAPGGHNSAAYPRAHVEGPDAKMQWINSAKGIVDATIDQAVTGSRPNSASGTRVRPKSASGPRAGSDSVPRRPHDRAR
jgi:methyl-accepting chemotaxis protein